MLNIPSDRKIYQYFPLPGPPKFTQIGIFWFENIPSGNPAFVRERVARKERDGEIKIKRVLKRNGRSRN
jgi:hypothetical protein